ncbi:hypothetical protein [Pyxidicoccus xibeiensis]|uniref:hypothetical protein n=1 Tax=Pyxidicoccus xibeiensis TaxID=2906759 RepID=UPI0020A6FB75|nr:hypothetical protein [Pyxidicoccus xibeiensis]MCP3142901.1 hypothetical protein [Pyxidicoccus xibeiensis]
MTSERLELKLEPGVEGVIHLMAVAPTTLQLSLASYELKGRKYRLQLKGTHKNLPADTKCRVFILAGPAAAKEDKLNQAVLDGVPLQGTEKGCSLDVEFDLYECGLFGKGQVRLGVLPDFPFAARCTVNGVVPYEHPLDVPDTHHDKGVLLGRKLELTPRRGDKVANATLRLSAFPGGALQAGLTNEALAFSIFEWPAGDTSTKEWRVGCAAESDGSPLLTWLSTSQAECAYDLRLEVIPESDGDEVAYVVWEKAQAIKFPKPRLAGFKLGFGRATAKVENVDPDFALPLELTLWSHAHHDRDAVVRSLVMNPLTRPAEAVASAAEYFSQLFTPGPVPDNYFALLRIPRTLTGTEAYVPVSAVMDYDEAAFLPFDDDQLWLEPPPKKKQDKAKKGAKELATAVASQELADQKVRPTRTPHFGRVTAGVRDGNLLVAIKLVGDTQYWKDAKPAYSLRDAATNAELVSLSPKASDQNPHLHEALIALNDKRIFGKQVSVHGAVTVPDALLWKELCAAPPAFSIPHDCVPRLGELERETVELTDATSHLLVRCRANHIPNGQNGATLGFRLYEIFADFPEPVLLRRVRFQYDLAKGAGGQCDSRGRLVARITDPELVERLGTHGRYRLEACVLNKEQTVLTVEVKPITVEFGGTPRETAGTIFYGQLVPDEFRKKVLLICADLEMNPDYLMACMAFETGETFKANKQNSAGRQAYGLIQFTKIAAKDLGKTLSELKAMSELEQLDYVHEYMARAKKRNRGPLKTLSDVYMAILCPAAMGKPETYVCYAGGTEAYKANDGLDKEKKGYITKADATAKVQAHYEVGKGLRK